MTIPNALPRSENVVPVTGTMLLSLDQVLGTQGAQETLWLDQRYAGYAENVRRWNYVEECLQGGTRWLQAKNLPPHPIELREIAGLRLTQGAGGPGGETLPTRPEYDSRVQGASRWPIVAEILDPLLEHLSRAHPSEPGFPAIPQVREFQDRGDRGRTRSLFRLMIRAVAHAIPMGIGYIAVDVSAVDAEIEAELLAAGATVERDDRNRIILRGSIGADIRKRFGPRLIPHAWVIDPRDMLFGEHDATGNLTQALIRETRSNGMPLESGQLGTETVYRLWKPGEISVWGRVEKGKETGKPEAVLLASPLVNTAQRVTVFPIVPKEGDSPWCGLPIIHEDYSLLERTIADLWSSLTQALSSAADKQTRLYMDLKSIDTKPKAEQDTILKSREMAARAPLGIFDKDDKIDEVTHEFPQAEIMLKTIQVAYPIAFRAMGLGDKIEGDSAQSGTARAMRSLVLMTKLAQIASAMQPVHLAALRAGAVLSGHAEADVPENAIQYPDRFDVWTEADLLEMITLLEGKAPVDVVRELIRLWLRKAFPVQPEVWFAARNKALDAWDGAVPAAAVMKAAKGAPPFQPRPPDIAVPVQ